jgi:hypothetical protein
MNSTFTITFGDQAENHIGMQKIGTMAQEGFSISDLEAAKLNFEAAGCKCQLVRLNNALAGSGVDGYPAAVLLVSGAVGVLTSKHPDEMFSELKSLQWDQKAKIYGRVVNRYSAYNVCFADFSQEPDYENGKGRIISFDDVETVSQIRKRLPEFIGPKAKDLCGEGNYYFDSSKCGIGFHGDAERRKVIGVRLGASIPLHYQWYHNGKPIGERIKITTLGHGDLYIASQKASGFDYKQKEKVTLRHAAGSEKYLQIKTIS